MTRYFDVNDAGHSIRCKLYCNDIHRINQVILFGHGFGGHKDNKAAEHFAEYALSKNRTAAVVIFNWPCHGDDVKKKLLLTDCDTYITCVLNYIRNRMGVEDICVYATSFGGYLFLKYIHEHGNPFRKLSFRCPAVKMYQVLTKSVISSGEYELLEKGKEASVGFDRKIKISLQFLKDLEAADISGLDFLDYADDLMMIHGTKDEIVPFESVYEFAENNVIELVAVENGDHRFMDPHCMEIATKRTLEFFGMKM